MKDALAGIGRRAPLPITVVLITAAALLWHHLPVPTQVFAPFDVHGSAGSPVRGQSLAATVTKLRAAPNGKFAVSRFTSIRVSAIGLWLVVDATVSAIESSTQPTADLVMGANTYQPSIRSPAPGFGVRVDPGLPQHGYWAFDVAPELLQPSITSPLLLRVGPAGEERLNSRLVIDLGNRPLESADVVTVKPYEVGPAE